MELSNALQEALAEQAQTLDVAALEQAFQQAGILPGDSWAGIRRGDGADPLDRMRAYERAKEIVRAQTQSPREYQAGIRFVTEYLGI